MPGTAMENPPPPGFEEQVAKARRSGHSVPGNDGIKFEASVLIDREPWEIYEFWRDLTNAARFMSDINKVEVHDERRSTWTASGPYNITVKWDAEVINDRPGELLSWRTVGDTKVPNAGSVRFKAVPGEDGKTRTRVRLVAEFLPPGGPLGVITAAFFFQDPQRVLQEDLRRLKQLLEGENPDVPKF